MKKIFSRILFISFVKIKYDIRYLSITSLTFDEKN